MHKIDFFIKMQLGSLCKHVMWWQLIVKFKTTKTLPSTFNDRKQQKWLWTLTLQKSHVFTTCMHCYSPTISNCYINSYIKSYSLSPLCSFKTIAWKNYMRTQSPHDIMQKQLFRTALILQYYYITRSIITPEMLLEFTEIWCKLFLLINYNIPTTELLQGCNSPSCYTM